MYFHDLTIFITSSINAHLRPTIIFQVNNFKNLFVLPTSVPPSLTLLNMIFAVSLDNESQIILLFCSLPSNGFLNYYHPQGTTCLYLLSLPHLSDLIVHHFPVYYNISVIPVSVLFLEHSKHVLISGHFHLLFLLLWWLFPIFLHESLSHVLQVSAIMPLIREAFLDHPL